MHGLDLSFPAICLNFLVTIADVGANMLGDWRKLTMIVAAGVIAVATAAPSMAADFHGHGGNVYYRGQHGAFLNGRGGTASNYHDRMLHWGGNRAGFENRYFGGDRGMTARNGQWRHGGEDRFGNRDFGNQDSGNFADRNFGNQGFDNHRHGERPHILASRDFSTRRGSGISVRERSQPDYDFISNYAGSTDVYRANGGTYVAGYGNGDGSNEDPSSQATRPRSKLIDVGRMRDACSHENGVCVIRP
jgi:hypothetical protein